MGHRAAKDAYEELTHKLDGSMVRLPDQPALRALLRELYTADEADLVASMPWGLARIDRVAQVTGRDAASLLPQLNALARKGLVLDLLKEANAERYYMPSPFVVGIYEFTMMRAGPAADHARRAELFREYLGAGDFYRANLGDGQQVFLARALPHRDTVADSTLVLLPDRVEAIIDQHQKFAVGVCSCRHEQQHLGARRCSTPLETCTAMGTSAEYLLRHGLARESSRSEMLEIVARSRETGLVLCADNVQREVSFICHCCRCCCQLVRGITEWGYPNAITTSPFVPTVDANRCSGCNQCVKACPIGALKRTAQDTDVTDPALATAERDPGFERIRATAPPNVDSQRCIGCGICATRCNRKAMHLVPGTRRRILPENSFERVILQCLERGTLQNLVFDNPRSQSQRAMRALLGGVLRLSPVRRALVSDAYRSTFLRGLAQLSGYDGP
jgi:Pyruvate/2-oxoacid:ferredoxin oxidoreductase delta subunit